MMDVGRHPNITLMTYSEVEAISGYVGTIIAVFLRYAGLLNFKILLGYIVFTAVMSAIVYLKKK